MKCHDRREFKRLLWSVERLCKQDRSHGRAKRIVTRIAGGGMKTTNSAHEAETMRVPEDLRFVVTQLVAMCDAGWEPCGFTGGGSGKVQFQKVEFRRRRNAD